LQQISYCRPKAIVGSLWTLRYSWPIGIVGRI
jgi:hypothetical protein